ncbi:uncharacterized protein LOC123546790 [Mercenaria mercenaria]|uniref:uncharacterized protein LOC123546790 n=1 Tax=Mercenaria mercenaria TaxID=6596 RepID=UPI00234F6D7F|nr:uncharacterized protein LOC123546790 [Mercenaria mercenaria]
MDQRVYLRLENGEIVALEDGTIPGTSYIVQDGVLASTSSAVQDSCTPSTSYVVDSTSLQNQTYTDRNESAQEEYVAEPTTLENIAVENDGTENVVYIVQHEGGTTDGMQYAVIGESGSVGSSFAVQTVSSGSTDARSEKTVDYTNITSIQDMSGIETLSRVATQEFAGSVIPSNSGTGTSQSIKGDYSMEAKPQNENELAEGNNDENISLSFYCQHCAETFEELESFRLHLKSEHDIIDVGGVSDSENVLTLFPTCQLCSQTFVDAKELQEHKKVHAGEFDPSCANTKSDQSSRADKQARKANFKCRFCDNYFENKSMMREHVATEHPDKSLPEEIKSSSFTKCPYCHKMYVLRGNNKSLIKHINLSHPGKSVDVVSSLADKEDQLEEKINCPFCDVGFFWEKSLIRHMKDQHPKILEETGDDIFAELGVQDVQTPNRRYRRSLNDGNQDVTLACPECPRKFLWEKSLRRHMVELHNEPTLRSRRNKKGPRVFQCPHCSLVSKYACAVRKHMERKHPEKVKGVDVSKLQLPTIEADAATDIELKTVDKRPAEERLNYCRFIFRCPFCTYACKQSSNLIRHLTSIKHGNIFSPEEIKDIGINSFKVEQKMVTDADEEENLDGTLNKRLSKLRLKGKLLDIVMTKYEILKQRKLENKENGIDGGENEDDFSDMDIDNIINVAEDESEESFNEEEDDDDDEKGRLEQTSSKRGTRKSKDAKTAEQKTEEKNEKDNGNIIGHADNIDIKTLNCTKHMTDGTEQVTAKGNENTDKKQKEENSGQKSDITTTDIEMIEILPLENTNIENDSDNEMDIDTDTGIDTVQLNNFGSSCRSEPNTSSRKLNTEDKVTSKQEINRLNGKNSRENNQRENQGNKQRVVDIQNKSASAADKVTSVGEKKMPLRSKSKPVEAANGNSGKTNTKANSLVCEVCHREFSSFTVFKEHLPSHVNIKVIFRCKECECEFPFLKDLKSHMKKEHNRSCSENDVADVHTNLVKMNSKPVTTYDCPYCEMLFSQSATLQQHVIIDHSDNIESTCIKQESGVTSRPTASETVVLAFNCHFCECFFRSINDIVKHMYIVHRDVERSSVNTSIDSAVRKSGRKRRVPKWLEEASADSSPAKKTKGQNPGNDNQMSKASNLTPVSRPREKKQSKFAGESNIADISKRSKETTGAEIVKEAKEGTGSVKKTKEQFQTKDTPKTKDVVELEDLNISGSDNSQGLEVERSPRSVNKGKKPFKKPEPSDIGKGPSDTQDKTENQNKCPHCDFVARRSSALTFHINLKHANVKTDIKEQEARKILAKSPKKTSTSDYPVVSRKNMETPNKGKQDIDKSGDTFVTRKGAELEKKGKTAVEMEKCQVDPDSLAKMKNNDNANSNRIQNSIGEVAELENEIEEIEDEMNDEEDYDIEFGDSDDDYKPDKDDYDDGDSDLDDLEDDDVDDGYSISVMLECPYCENGLFQSFSILESHVKKKHPEKANTFSVIDVKTKVELDGTVKSSNLVHTCKYCKKNFSSRSHVRAHVKNKHGKKLVDTSGKSSGEAIDENTEFYKCHFCSVVSESRENVLSHINRQHPLEKVHLSDIERYKPSKEDIIKNVFNCPHCEKKNIWKQGMLRHISKTHPEVKDESHKIVCEKEVVKNKPKNLYQCVYCNWQYEKRADVLAHITDTHSDQPQVTEDDIVEVDIADKVDNNFQCPYCDLKSKYKRCVIRHVNRAHSEMKGFTHSDVICLRSLKRKIAAAEGLIYMCPYCDFDSRWKQCVIRHVDINHPDVMHLKTGAIPSEYRKRSVVNLDENSELEKDNDRKLDYFKCPYCDAISETKKGVVEHTLTYHPKKSTINRSQVKKAVWDEVDISNKGFVYKCLACNSGSKRKKTVVLHVRKAHPEVKKFRIELCRAEFINSERNTDDMYKCKLCNELFMTTRGVSAHCMHVHPDEAKIVIETVRVSEKLTNIFKCMYCDHSSGWRKAIIKHVEIHHSDIKNFQAKDVICEIVQEKELQGSGGFQCPYCNTVNHWKKSIIRHIKTVHPNERQDLEIHFNPAASVKSGGRSCRKSSKQIKCLRCGISCRSIEKMRKHFLSKHPKLAKNYLGKGNTELVYDASNGRQLDYVCVLCSAKYMWKKSLLVHIKCRHREMFHVYQALDHVVDIVAGGTDGQWHAEQPDVSATNQPTPVSKPQVVKKDTEIPKTRRCEKCNVVFKSQWDANVHARLKHRKSLKNRFPCSKCSLSFRTQSLRLKHKIRCHRYQRCGSTLHCTVAGCNFRCKFHKVLQNHYSYSHNLKIPILGNTTFSTYGAEGSVRCEMCLRTFSSADQLKQHVDLHKKSRPVRFECGTCGEQFLTRSLRDTHIETFHFDKLEMCDVCGNLYTRANLKKHIKTHEEDQSGNKVCPYCDQCFTVKMFNRHVFNEHQEILNCQCVIYVDQGTWHVVKMLTSAQFVTSHSVRSPWFMCTANLPIVIYQNSRCSLVKHALSTFLQSA